MILCSVVFVFLELHTRFKIDAEEGQIMNHSFNDLKSPTSSRLIIFDLPSIQVLKENTDPIVNDLVKQLVAKAYSYLLQKAPSIMDKL